MKTRKPILAILAAVLTIFPPFSAPSQEVGNTTAGKIQSGDYPVAMQGVSEAKSKRDLASLALGLKHRILDVREASVDAIVELNSQEAVPALIEGWLHNQIPRSGGTGARNQQKEIDQKLAVALIRFTGQQVDQTRPLTQEQMQQIIEVSKTWVTQHTIKAP